MDILGADFYGAVDQIKNRLGKNAICLQLPIGKEDDFKGIIDLFEMKAYIYNDEKGEDISIVDIPEDMKDEAELYRAELVEKVSELDDEKPSISASTSGSSIINATITDNVGVVGYQITESSTTPTTWVKIDSSKLVIKTFEKLKSSTNYYIHAIDEAGNTNYKNVKTGSGVVIIIVPDDPDPDPGPTNPSTGGDCWTVGLCDDDGGSSGGTSNPGTGAYVEPDPVCITGKNGMIMCDRWFKFYLLNVSKGEI